MLILSYLLTKVDDLFVLENYLIKVNIIRQIFYFVHKYNYIGSWGKKENYVNKAISILLEWIQT